MRDPKRIDRVTEKLNEIWHKYPDLRFWQLLLVIPWDYAGDAFYLEDVKVEKVLDKILKEGL